MVDSDKFVSTEESFAALVVEARAGSRQSLGELLQRSQRYLWLVAERELPAKLQSKEAPSDLVQMTCLDAQEQFGHFAGHTQHDLLAWLRQILLHHVAHVHRRYEQTAKTHVDCEEVHISAHQDAWQLHAAQPVPTPSSFAIEHERQTHFRQAIEALPEDYQQVIVWHHRDQLEFDEIARRMDRSTAAVRKLWTRAVGRLQGLLETGDGS